ncbi:hypothetical protein BO94DRAFT_551492 [Aspergillus sclerotioniger CBS 115572]|uniref:FAD-binding PCMH-type domain-containing protein n=1 Tax=Aspergillus sclerotioniger CBS 115572 TaxID=1450535 RepID=A0A317V2V3_9EURO|nr:hypothetical protein BO94DRAFT_551492 [Aspergillus sclerotioniger CBS 115572]PWY66520.1 hypothetical protein BO94DRAFT_551492 [Aspergillus sclerotioniger CBS 115572]
MGTDNTSSILIDTRPVRNGQVIYICDRAALEDVDEEDSHEQGHGDEHGGSDEQVDRAGMAFQSTEEEEDRHFDHGQAGVVEELVGIVPLAYQSVLGDVPDMDADVVGLDVCPSQPSHGVHADDDENIICSDKEFIAPIESTPGQRDVSNQQSPSFVPLAAACYPSWPEYNRTECAYVTDEWTDSYMHAADPASVMWPLFEGRSCLPRDLAVGNCTLGGYSSYAVNGCVWSPKNTGHDFNGKSTGAGALGVWTHNLKDIVYYQGYHVGNYSGPAVKMGAGVQAFEIYEKANELGFTAVGGEGKTVGVEGGYVLGGGHSPMSSVYGLAADQVLALEVVLANGRFVTVTEQSDPDLFWALRGGGGGTYGIVTSIISRVHPKVPVTVDTFWAGVRAYLERFPVNADAGTYAYFWVLSTGTDSFEFLMNPYFAVNHTVDEFNCLMAPCRFNQTIAALRSTVSAGYPLLAFNLKADLSTGYAESSANPAFRQTLMHAISSTSWASNTTDATILADMKHFTYDILGEWRRTCPEAGVYMSEADIMEPNFHQAFYGS